jgi:hypothetical protein
VTEKKKWEYLDVCRGRYLCPAHGSFCDSSDAYQNYCPRCQKDCELMRARFENNPVDRGLQIMRNLQNRSARYASILAGLFASIAAIAILLAERDLSSGTVLNNYYFQGVCLISVATGLSSLGLFLWSMGHMPTIGSKGPEKGRFMKKTIYGWEEHVAHYLSLFERRHTWGIFVFLIAVTIFIIVGPIVLIF